MKIKIEELTEKASKGPFYAQEPTVDGVGRSNTYLLADHKKSGAKAAMTVAIVNHVQWIDGRGHANAQLIAHCLNNFGPMLEALSIAIQYMPLSCEKEHIQAEIDKVYEITKAASTVEVSQ